MQARNGIVDRLRGLCVLAVFTMHFALVIGVSLRFLNYGLGNGYYGVVAFFSISGYLITTKMLERGSFGRVSALPAFYRFRLGRIVPNLGLLVVFLSAMSLTTIAGFSLQENTSLSAMVKSIFTLTFNVLYKQGAVVASWAPLWSLMVEEVFYIAFPLILIISRKISIAFVLMIVLCVVGPLYRQKGIGTYYDYLGCFDNIAWGVMAAICARHFAASLSRMASISFLAVGSTALAITYTCTDCHTWICLGPTFTAASTASILFCSATKSLAKKAKFIDPLMALGSLSYEVYLFHFAAIMLVARLSTSFHFLTGWTAYAFTGGLVTVVSYLVKTRYADPINDIIRRWKPRFFTPVDLRSSEA